MDRVDLYISLLPLNLPNTVGTRDTKLLVLHNPDGVTVGDLVEAT
jgi:hypothetical protein